MEINDVRVMGIWGMGGIGKTTLARALFSTVSYQYEAACFLQDIKENKYGMRSLQNILLSKLLGENVNVGDNEEGKQMMARRLCCKKVLVVLDDIDDIDHLENLGDRRWFGSGSRIIATTRDKHLIWKNDIVYEMTTLVDHEALQLFNQYAFKEEVPDKPFEELTLEVLNYAKGLPLALKVWGSLLYNRDITEWRSAIADMRKNSNSKIVDKLIISYNRLEPTQQKMFLDLACFLRGEKREKSKQILESCDFEVDFGLRILIDRSLVFISSEDRIEMHDLIQEMGKHVVNMQREPGERSRLWLCEDIREVLENNTGTKAVEAIWLPWNTENNLNFSNDSFRNMSSLRIFYLNWWGTQDGSIGCLPNSLRWFVWNNYPWESLPETFEPKKLVHLQLTYNNLHFLWTGIKDLRHLRTLDLTNSRRLKRTPDFTGMPNLERLNLDGCNNLKEVPPSLGCCRKLIWLCLIGCSKLERLPEEIGDLENLKTLDARLTAISTPPSSIVLLNKLKYLTFAGSKVREFPSVGEGLRSLEVLDFYLCNLKYRRLPEDFGCLSSLKKLNLGENKFEHLPRSIAQLGALRSLGLRDCKRLKELPELPPELEELSANSDVILKNIHSLATKKMLKLLVFNPLYDKDDAYNGSLNSSFAHALYIFSMQQDISTSDSLSHREFIVDHSRKGNIPSWFRYKGIDSSVSVNLPKNWYIHDKFLGFVICFTDKYNTFQLIETTIQLIPLCDNDGEVSWMTQKLAYNYSQRTDRLKDHFFFVPLAGLWDTSKANGKTPNDYGHIRLYHSGEMEKYGIRLLYKDEPELESGDKDESELESGDKDESELESGDNDELELEPLIQMTIVDTMIGISRSRYDNSGHHDSATNEACCSLGHSLKSMRSRLLRMFGNKSRDSRFRNVEVRFM